MIIAIITITTKNHHHHILKAGHLLTKLRAKVSKSSLNWQTSVLHLQISRRQLEPSEIPLQSEDQNQFLIKINFWSKSISDQNQSLIKMRIHDFCGKWQLRRTLMWSRCCSRRGRQIHRLPAQRKNCWPEQLWSLPIILDNTITSSEYHFGQTSKTQQTPKELAQDPLVVPLKYSRTFTSSAPFIVKVFERAPAPSLP